jgi:hypothetical protein
MYSQKDRLHVLILSHGLQIAGDLHVLAGSRLTDALNSKGKDFFPVTDATITVIGALSTTPSTGTASTASWRSTNPSRLRVGVRPARYSPVEPTFDRSIG